MKCIIVEDGSRAATHLENLLASGRHEVTVQALLDSVESAVEWLRSNKTDLIFLDVQLGDGLSFEIFDHVYIDTPVIFTTSYDQYLMRAFDVNSIAYLLKPVKASELDSALLKYERLYRGGFAAPDLKGIDREYQKRFMVHKGNVIRTIPAGDVAYAYIHGKGQLIIVDSHNESYLVESTLDRLEQRLNPAMFFRINRQFIVNINAIRTIIPVDAVRMKIETTPASKEELVVSSKRIRQFRDWLNQ